MKVIRVHYPQLFKRICLSILIIVLMYVFLIRKKRYSDTFVTVVNGVQPKLVWEFVADFTNQQRINPTMLDFEIEYEKGNYNNWEYGVIYREYSLTFPFIRYKNRVIIQVLPVINTNENHRSSKPYRILSDFTSCVVGLCLQTSAEMKFVPGDERRSTKIMESVQFDCPPIISVLCYRDLRAQKKLIYDNIRHSTDIMI